MSAKHIEGRPVSASTYQYRGCRCDGCRAAASAAQARSRAKNGNRFAAVQSRQRQLALAWVRTNHPDKWAELLQQAYADVGIARQPMGRPPRSVA